MDDFSRVFASFASPFASLARLESVVLQRYCFICFICSTPALYVRRVFCISLFFISLAYDITNMKKMKQMKQTTSYLIVFIDEVFCFTFEVVKQMKQKPFVSLKKMGLSWI